MSTYNDYDFIGFTYNGKHSLRDLKIYRTSTSGRYDESLTPTLKEKTQSVEGMDGLLYFGTNVEQKVFTVPFAFDNLSEVEFRELKKLFNGKQICPLIFDETPYKVYMAKVTGTNSIKYMCFEVDGQREYRGEGTLQFTCYYPYARTRHSDELSSAN
jgi:predicted phage tail component-like protein